MCERPNSLGKPDFEAIENASRGRVLRLKHDLRATMRAIGPAAECSPSGC